MTDIPRTGDRIIPARAGFTDPLDDRGLHGWDHPRSRGVYPSDLQRFLEGDGSSPLARGLPPEPTGSLCASRIIPARAGFTRHTDRTRLRDQDHPRSRGVYRAPHPRARPPAGSSPLARGLLGAGDGGATVRGIIPARAGFTTTPPSPFSCATDHPRSRGVYRHARHPALLGGGSSPLARGLRPPDLPCHADVRIIPARAGFTSTTGASAAPHGDHPRSRGVYPRCPPSAGSAGGSSPLARGLHGRVGEIWDAGRIIPARAGFTTRPGASS